MKEEYTQYHRAINRVSQEYRKILIDTHVEIESLSVTLGCEECDSSLAFSEGDIVLRQSEEGRR